MYAVPSSYVVVYIHFEETEYVRICVWLHAEISYWIFCIVFLVAMVHVKQICTIPKKNDVCNLHLRQKVRINALLRNVVCYKR